MLKTYIIYQQVKKDYPVGSKQFGRLKPIGYVEGPPGIDPTVELEIKLKDAGYGLLFWDDADKVSSRVKATAMKMGEL